MNNTAYIGLGSNMGDREHYLRQAVAMLSRHHGVTVSRCPPYMKQIPWVMRIKISFSIWRLK